MQNRWGSGAIVCTQGVVFLPYGGAERESMWLPSSVHKYCRNSPCVRWPLLSVARLHGYVPNRRLSTVLCSNSTPREHARFTALVRVVLFWLKIERRCSSGTHVHLETQSLDTAWVTKTAPVKGLLCCDQNTKSTFNRVYAWQERSVRMSTNCAKLRK